LSVYRKADSLDDLILILCYFITFWIVQCHLFDRSIGSLDATKLIFWLFCYLDSYFCNIDKHVLQM